MDKGYYFIIIIIFFPENRKIYEGEFKNNKREGSGTMYWKDGYKFSANFKNNKIILDNNSNFQWYFDRESEVIFNFQNGDVFEGYFFFEFLTGNGKLFYNSGNLKGSIYDGSISNGLRSGKGIMIFNNGNRYEGDWKNDKIEGKGIMNFNIGNGYEGDWKNDKIVGKGIMIFNGGDRYEGDQKNNVYEGKGIYFWKDGRKYEGNWKNDKREGV